jgi:hypothetical protein
MLSAKEERHPLSDKLLGEEKMYIKKNDSIPHFQMGDQYLSSLFTNWKVQKALSSALPVCRSFVSKL